MAGARYRISTWLRLRGILTTNAGSSNQSPKPCGCEHAFGLQRPILSEEIDVLLSLVDAPTGVGKQLIFLPPLLGRLPPPPPSSTPRKIPGLQSPGDATSGVLRFSYGPHRTVSAAPPRGGWRDNFGGKLIGRGGENRVVSQRTATRMCCLQKYRSSGGPPEARSAVVRGCVAAAVVIGLQTTEAGDTQRLVCCCPSSPRTPCSHRAITKQAAEWKLLDDAPGGHFRSSQGPD